MRLGTKLSEVNSKFSIKYNDAEYILDLEWIFILILNKNLAFN